MSLWSLHFETDLTATAIDITFRICWPLRLIFWSKIKGQLISECLFDVLDFPKNQRKIWQISALESKKWSNHKIKAHYNDFDTNYVQIILNIIRRCLYFVDLTTFYILGQKFVKFFIGFLENLRLSKRHSEINWPLALLELMSFLYFL